MAGHPGDAAGHGRKAEGTTGGPGPLREFDDQLRKRLDVITDPGYTDPAREDLGAVDWVLFVGFLLACAVGAVIWGA
jgi:hypothetical protein